MKLKDCKVGMRVVAVDICDGENLRGKTGTVRAVGSGWIERASIGVEFDDAFDHGNTLTGRLKHGSKRGWWCECESIEPIEGIHIAIDSYGIKTDIHAVINGRVVDKTVRVAKEDTSSAYVGALMALNKAFGVHLGRAKNGENVIVINPQPPCNYSLGDVVRMENDVEGTIIKNAMPVMLFAAEYAIIDDISILTKPSKTRKVVCVAVDKSGSHFVVGNVYVVGPDNTISLDGGKVCVVHDTAGEPWMADGKNKFVVINEDGKDTD